MIYSKNRALMVALESDGSANNVRLFPAINILRPGRKSDNFRLHLPFPPLRIYISARITKLAYAQEALSPLLGGEGWVRASQN